MNNLRVFREKSGLNQTQLAVMVGVTQSMMNQLEKGNKGPSLQTARRVVEAFKSSGVPCYIEQVFPPVDELNPIAYPRDRFQEYAKAG